MGRSVNGGDSSPLWLRLDRNEVDEPEHLLVVWAAGGLPLWPSREPSPPGIMVQLPHFLCQGAESRAADRQRQNQNQSQEHQEWYEEWPRKEKGKGKGKPAAGEEEQGAKG